VAARPEFLVISFAVFVTCFDFGFPHGLAVEICAVCVVDEAV
jgi:hypothetical protein